jgi:hypothetical protein
MKKKGVSIHEIFIIGLVILVFLVLLVALIKFMPYWEQTFASAKNFFRTGRLG